MMLILFSYAGIFFSLSFRGATGNSCYLISIIFYMLFSLLYMFICTTFNILVRILQL
jgi:hypothetical protein